MDGGRLSRRALNGAGIKLEKVTMERIEITDRLTVGKAHPGLEDFEQLAREGFRAVVNLRTADEEGQPLTPEREGDKVRALGMSYLHFPVNSDDISERVVDRFRAAIQGLPRPLFAHCKSGTRSGAFLVMHVAAEVGMTGEEALAKAEELGFECDSEELERFVRRYVDQRRRH